MKTSVAAALPIFVAVFIAELGDKTQLATLLFAADGRVNPWMVFAASALALTLSAGIGVAVGAVAAEQLKAVPLKLVAGIGFIAIGLWTLRDHFS